MLLPVSVCVAGLRKKLHFQFSLTLLEGGQRGSRKNPLNVGADPFNNIFTLDFGEGLCPLSALLVGMSATDTVDAVTHGTVFVCKY